MISLVRVVTDIPHGDRPVAAATLSGVARAWQDAVRSLAMLIEIFTVAAPTPVITCIISSVVVP